MNNVIHKLKLTDIVADEDFNCRGKIAPHTVVELSKDIELHGLLQPVIVIPQKEGKYKLIAGFRRYMAHRVIKRDVIDSIIRDDMSMGDALVLNLNENIQRTDLNMYQEARALEKLQELGVTEDDAAKRLNKSRGWIQVRFLLLKLPQAVQSEAEAGMLSQTQVRELYSVFLKSGKESTYKAAKELKEYKQRQEAKKVKVTKPKGIATNSDIKTKRNKTDIFKLMDHLQATIGLGLHSRCLAWSVGEISDKELFESIAEYAVDNEKFYVAPDNL